MLLLAACRGIERVPPPRFEGAGATTPRRGGTLRFSITDDVRNLDPAIAYDEFSQIPTHLIFDTLLDYDSALSADPTALVPELASAWSVSPDGLVYKFTLRPGISYADGTPIVAGDFVYAISRVLDPATASPGGAFFTGITGGQDRLDGKTDTVRGLVAVDDTHLEIHLDKPDASFPLLLAMGFAAPVTKAWVTKQGKRMRDTPLASGPFVLASWSPGERMVFKRNPRYWNPDRPYLDEIQLSLQVSRDVAVLKFLRGELDTVERLSSDQYVRFKASPEWAPYVHAVAGMNVYGELMDVKVPPFDDKRVRQALNYAINKEDSVRVYNGRAVVAHGILPPHMPGYDAGMPPYPYDPEQAKRLLAEAGYPNGFSVTYVTTKDELAEKVAESIQSDLAKVGVKVRIELMTFPTYLTAVGRHEISFAYTGWVMDFPDPWDFLEVKFHSRMITPENSNNDTNYANPEVDRLLDQARAEQNRAKRLALYHQVEEILYDDCPWIWHYHAMVVEVVQPYVKGYKFHVVWQRMYRDTWLDLPRRAM